LARSGSIKHPIIFFTIAGIAERLASAWEGIPLPVENAELVDAHLLPKLEALLDVADSDDLTAVNTTVTAALKAEAEARH